MPINSKKIVAKNVVEGVQTIGTDADPALIAAAASAAREILASGKSGITADEITADNVVEGVQFIKDSAHPTLDELRQEIAAKLLALTQDKTAPPAAQAALAQVQLEAKKDKPDPGKLVEGLEKLSSTLKNLTDAAPNVLKIVRWVPAIIALVKTWAGVP